MNESDIMEDNLNNLVSPKDWEPENKIQLKVIGVGGAGCNAVTYMHKIGIQGCTFIVCNTDRQALSKSDVPVKIQLGPGLGAGTDPILARNYALESQDSLEEIVFSTRTDMLFITAGMGGGTGTGATPVIASMAKKKGILTVGVVTIPFINEGDEAMARAVDGIRELEKNVDSLLIINNQKLYEFYGDSLAHKAFPEADEILATAIRGITEIIQETGYINVDIKDVQTMMRNSGMALMGYGSGKGKNRLEDAVKQAMESPLLNDFDLTTAKNVLINITGGLNENGLRMKELEQIGDLINGYTGNANNFKKGVVFTDDPEIGDGVRITVIVTGFKVTKLLGPRENLGNLIIIDENFVYTREQGQESGEIELPDTPEAIKIGYNTSDSIRKFHFSDDEKPVMIVEPGQNLSAIEHTPAIRRSRK